ncbi:MAG: yabQ [Firmicutes bacterium]|nr:yabQ [Bacillota bacterium]
MGVTGQFETFLLTILAGVILGVVFDVYRVMRGVFRPRWIVTSVTDLFYWLLATAIVFVTLIAGNGGEVRFYVFLGLVSGVAVYYRLLSKRAIGILIWLVRCVVRVFNGTKRMLLMYIIAPVLWGAKLLGQPVCRSVRRIFSREKSEEDNVPK